MPNCYIVGHKNPDTDSIIAAIALAEYKKQTGLICQPSLTGDPNKETEYVLSRFGFETPVLLPEGEKEVVLVDTTQPAQIDEKIDSSQIIEVVDHHNLGGLTTPSPIPVIVEPLGSTGSLVAKLFYTNNKEISPAIAGLLISCIVSDTLNLTSPTTTEEDKNLLAKLNEIAGIDVDQLANEMFAAKSDISDISTSELLGKDYKVFEMNGKKIGFGVWETVKPEAVLERKEEILVELAKKKEAENLFNIYFSVVDILNNSSELILITSYEEEVAKEVFGGEISDQIMHLPGVVSRKKQMIPPLEAYFAKN